MPLGAEGLLPEKLPLGDEGRLLGGGENEWLLDEDEPRDGDEKLEPLEKLRPLELLRLLEPDE